MLGGNGSDYGSGISTDTNGNLYLCGTGDSTNIAGTSPSGVPDYLVYKLNSSGQFDSGFDGDGKMMLAATNTEICPRFPAAISVDNTGGIYLSGSDSQSGFEFTTARLLADGTPDTGFNGSGQRMFSGEGHDVCTDSFIDNDGSSLFLVGRSLSNTGDFSGEPPSQGTSDACLMKITTGGIFDTTFSGNGIATLIGNSADGFFPAASILMTPLYMPQETVVLPLEFLLLLEPIYLPHILMPKATW